MATSWERLYAFNVENWYKSLNGWIIHDKSGAPYMPCAKCKVIRITIQEAVCLIRGMATGCKSLKRLKKMVEHVLTSEGTPMFFKLSTRSAKDAWQQIDPSIGVDEEEDDDYTRRRKLELQTELLRVHEFKDILDLIRCSERLMDDLQQYIEHSSVDQTMCVVLQEWRPSSGEEYRCFVKRGKLIACCRYHTAVLLRYGTPMRQRLFRCKKVNRHNDT